MSKLALLDAIKEYGPMTSVQLSEELGVSRSYARACVAYCKRKKLIYVLRYEREAVDGHLYPRAVYQLGNQPDARRLPRLSKRAYDQRHRDKKQARVASVFALGIPVDAKRVTTRKRPDAARQKPSVGA
jgi:hypothetical protein